MVVGCGVSAIGQLTTEAIAWIRRADKVLHVLASPIATAVVEELNPSGAESVGHFYAVGKDRGETYEQIVERTLECVRSGWLTVLALSGHPGVFAYSSHESIRRARAEGYSARMLPAVSALDCLFADLGVDPYDGLQCLEATDLALCKRSLDPSSNLVVFQVGAITDWTYSPGPPDVAGLQLLQERLLRTYPRTHTVLLYEAAMSPDAGPKVGRVKLASLPRAAVSQLATLFVPRLTALEVDARMVKRLSQLRTAAPRRR